jgi:hypothetical protein
MTDLTGGDRERRHRIGDPLFAAPRGGLAQCTECERRRVR